MDQATFWLIRLTVAHLLTDFVLQPQDWVKARNIRHLKAWQFWAHISLTTAVAACFTAFDTLWLLPAIFLSHGAIDWWKSHRPEKLVYFLLDQFLHVLVLVLVWTLRFPEARTHLAAWAEPIGEPKIWVILLGLLVLSRPAGIVTGMLTTQFRAQIQHHRRHSLGNAGTWIGFLERFIVFFLVLKNQYEAIGLLVAAKSILRLKEGDQKMSEYVLIGTLISFSLAMLVGMAVSTFLS
jgi:hypothetical protein